MTPNPLSLQIILSAASSKFLEMMSDVDFSPNSSCPGLSLGDSAITAYAFMVIEASRLRGS